MTTSPLHVLFSPSAAGTLRQTLKRLGLPKQIVCFYDDFSFGPISSDDVARVTWIENVFGIDDWASVLLDTGAVLDRSCSGEVAPVVWISRRDTRSYTGFLWWLSHRGEAPCDIIDLTDLTWEGMDAEPGEPLALGPGSLSSKAMERLLNTERPLGLIQRREYFALWNKLRIEDAPFRVIRSDGVLASATLSYFDPLLLSCAKHEWQKASRVIGEALAKNMEENINQVGDLALYACACRLAEAGALEWRGNLASMTACEFRLPAAHPSDGGMRS